MRRSVLSTLAALLILLFPAVAHAGFAPANRATFQCENQDCNNGPNFITFNSFTNSPVNDAPSNGDERAFFEAKDAASSTSTQTGFGDNLSVRDGETVMFRVYIHNNANPNLMGGEEATMARNTRVSVQLPTSSNSNAIQGLANISADNATPNTISDTVELNSGNPFTLVLDQNSPVNMTVRSNDGAGDFMTFQQTGVSISGNSLSVSFAGWPGGFEHHGMLTFIAVVHMNPSTITSTASFSCSNINVTTVDRNSATLTVNNPNNQNNNVSYSFSVRNSSGAVVDTNNLSTSAQTAVYNFNQSNPDTYTVATVVNNGSAGAVTCIRQIVVTTQPVSLSASTSQSTSTPPPSTNLPNTGAGSAIGMFAAVSSVAGIGHYLWNYRRSRI